MTHRFDSYNRYPDEKGTERRTTVTPNFDDITANGVTTVTPMKRGLKGKETKGSAPWLCRYNRYPDEKGTESFHADQRRRGTILRVTTVTPMKRGLKVCNDEKSSSRFITELQPLPR